jgi:hypothetical protein
MSPSVSTSTTRNITKRGRFLPLAVLVLQSFLFFMIVKAPSFCDALDSDEESYGSNWEKSMYYELEMKALEEKKVQLLEEIGSVSFSDYTEDQRALNDAPLLGANKGSTCLFQGKLKVLIESMMLMINEQYAYLLNVIGKLIQHYLLSKLGITNRGL